MCYVPWCPAGVGSVAVCSVLDSELVTGPSELSEAAWAAHSRSFSAFSTSLPSNIMIRKHDFEIFIYLFKWFFFFF